MASTPPGGGPRADESKAALRTAIRARRSARAVDPVADEARTSLVLELSRGHRTVAVYASVPPEPTTWALIDALPAAGVRVLLPVLRREPEWAPYEGRDALRTGPLGIPEPTSRPLGADALAAATMIWCPALAATPAGVRLGTGGGWYDRALAWRGPESSLGVLLYADEVLDAIPRDPWDRDVDVIVTERGVLRCRPPE